MPSRSGTNSTRRSAALLAWRVSMLTGWWRSRQVRALARNRHGTRSPAGHPRAGSGASGSRKCASSAAAPAGSRPAVSSTMIRACCHEIVPACRAARVSGSAVVSAWQSDRRAPADRSLTVRTHATSATTAISWAVCSCGDAAGGASAPAACTYSAASRTFSAAVRASSRATSASPSRQASASSRNGSSRRGSASRDGSMPGGSERSAPGAGQGSQRGNRRGDGLQGLPALHTPGGAFHTPIPSGGYDNFDGPGGAASAKARSERRRPRRAGRPKSRARVGHPLQRPARLRQDWPPA